MTTAQELKSMKQEIAEMKSLIEGTESKSSNGNGHHMLTRAEIHEIANKAGKSVRGFLSDKRDQFDAAKTRTEKTIKARPLTSAAVALAGGLVLGALLRRR